MNTKMKVLLGTTAIILNGTALAVSPEAYITDSGIAIVPIVNAGYKYDNNIFSQDDDTKESGIFMFSPSTNFLLDDGVNSYQVDIGAQWGMFIDSSEDNSFAGDLGFTTHLEPSSRSRFDIEFEANKKIETRGSGITEGLGDIVDEPISYNEQLAQLTYEYGSLSSSARIAFTGSYYNKNYTNFAAITQFRNFNKSTVGSTFFYSTNSSTDAFLEIKNSNTKFDISENFSRDSEVFTALIGVKWEATALTSGSFKIGQEEKDFSDAGREDFKGVSWEGNINWQPLTYTTLSLTTSRATKNPDVQGDFIKESVYGVNWTHEWNEKITSTLNYSYRDEDYSGFERVDKNNNFYADVIYQFKRWADISLYMEHTDKDSTNEDIVYDKTVIGLDFTFSL